jgi:hypothetical protein
MEHIWLGLLLLAILVLVVYVPNKEGMTNKDLLATLNRFGTQGTKSKSSSKDTYQEEIYGPKAPKSEEPVPASSSGGTSANDTNVYPDIYGPEITPVPGMKKSKTKSNSKSNTNAGSHTSDVVEDDTYEFNPDFRKAFPVDDDEPQPFLTDFSKFQH